MSRNTLTEQQWNEVLAEPGFISEKMRAVLKLVYQQKGHRAAAGWLGDKMGYRSTNTSITPNRIVGSFGKKLKDRYNLEPIARSDGTLEYWAHVFEGAGREEYFEWIMRPELVEAFQNESYKTDYIYPDEIDLNDTKDFFEGALTRVMVNSYERNRRARQACIDHHKPICSVCSFDFSKVYGEHGLGFIHVHHLVPVATRGQNYRLDPVKDLRPVCPNCHAMLHKDGGLLSIKELKSLMEKQKKAGLT